MSSNVATLIRQKNGAGDGRVYRLTPPFEYETGSWTDGKPDTAETEYVWVSATVVPYSGPETYIFASDEDGEVVDWSELPGSLRGELNHEQALRNAGYEVQS